MPESMRAVRATEYLIPSDIPKGLLWNQEAPRPESRRAISRRVAGRGSQGPSKYHIFLKTIPDDIETLAEQESRGRTNTTWFNTQVSDGCASALYAFDSMCAARSSGGPDRSSPTGGSSSSRSSSSSSRSTSSRTSTNSSSSSSSRDVPAIRALAAGIPVASKLHYKLGLHVNVLKHGLMRYSRKVQTAIYADPLEAIHRVARGRQDRLLEGNIPGMLTAAAELRLAARVEPPAALMGDQELAPVFFAAERLVFSEHQEAGNSPMPDSSNSRRSTTVGDTTNSSSSQGETPAATNSSSSSSDGGSESSSSETGSSSDSLNSSTLRWPLDPANVSTFLALVLCWPPGLHHFLLEACHHSRCMVIDTRLGPDRTIITFTEAHGRKLVLQDSKGRQVATKQHTCMMTIAAHPQDIPPVGGAREAWQKVKGWTKGKQQQQQQQQKPVVPLEQQLFDVLANVFMAPGVQDFQQQLGTVPGDVPTVPADWDNSTSPSSSSGGSSQQQEGNGATPHASTIAACMWWQAVPGPGSSSGRSSGSGSSNDGSSSGGASSGSSGAGPAAGTSNTSSSSSGKRSGFLGRLFKTDSSTSSSSSGNGRVTAPKPPRKCNHGQHARNLAEHDWINSQEKLAMFQTQPIYKDLVGWASEERWLDKTDVSHVIASWPTLRIIHLVLAPFRDGRAEHVNPDVRLPVMPLLLPCQLLPAGGCKGASSRCTCALPPYKEAYSRYKNIIYETHPTKAWHLCTSSICGTGSSSLEAMEQQQGCQPSPQKVAPEQAPRRCVAMTAWDVSLFGKPWAGSSAPTPFAQLACRRFSEAGSHSSSRRVSSAGPCSSAAAGYPHNQQQQVVVVPDGLRAPCSSLTPGCVSSEGNQDISNQTEGVGAAAPATPAIQEQQVEQQVEQQQQMELQEADNILLAFDDQGPIGFYNLSRISSRRSSSNLQQRSTSAPVLRSGSDTVAAANPTSSSRSGIGSCRRLPGRQVVSEGGAPSDCQPSASSAALQQAGSATAALSSSSGIGAGTTATGSSSSSHGVRRTTTDSSTSSSSDSRPWGVLSSWGSRSGRPSSSRSSRCRSTSDGGGDGVGVVAAAASGSNNSNSNNSDSNDSSSSGNMLAAAAAGRGGRWEPMLPPIRCSSPYAPSAGESAAAATAAGPAALDPVLHGHDDQVQASYASAAAAAAAAAAGTKSQGTKGPAATGFLRWVVKRGASLKAKVVTALGKVLEGSGQDDPTSQSAAAAAARKLAAAPPAAQSAEAVRWHSNAVAGARRGSGTLSARSSMSGVSAAAPWSTAAGGW